MIWKRKPPVETRGRIVLVYENETQRKNSSRKIDFLFNG
jgi:hypothetical protein